MDENPPPGPEEGSRPTGGDPQNAAGKPPGEGSGAGASQSPHLREMRIGQLLDAAFKLYRSNWKLFMGITAIVMVPYLGIQSIAISLLNVDPRAVPTRTPPDDLLPAFILMLLAAGLFILATPFLAGAMTRATSEIYLGRTPKFGEVARFALAKFGSILLVSILMFLAVLAGFIMFIIPGIIFMVRLLFSQPVVVVENLTGTKAMSRSWNLSRGSGWKIFGTILLAAILATIVTLVIQIPFASIGEEVGGGAGLIISFIGTAIATIVANPFFTIVTVLLYFDTRVRRENFDLSTMSREMQPPA